MTINMAAEGAVSKTDGDPSNAADSSNSVHLAVTMQSESGFLDE